MYDENDTTKDKNINIEIVFLKSETHFELTQIKKQCIKNCFKIIL